MFKLSKKNTAGVIGISASRDGFSLAHCVQTSTWPEFSYCEYIACSANKYEEKLASIISKRQLEGACCHYILQEDDYRLLLLETPNVPENEVSQAARWLVKDLIDFPLKDAVIDTFPMPVRAGQPAKMYAVVIQKARLEAVMEMIKLAKLNLTRVSIPELAFRNLLTYLPEVNEGIALLKRGKENNHIIIVREQLLYLTRPIDTNRIDTALTEDLDAIEPVSPEEIMGVLSSDDASQGASEEAPEEIAEYQQENANDTPIQEIEISHSGEVFMPPSAEEAAEEDISSQNEEMQEEQKSEPGVMHDETEQNEIEASHFVSEIQRSFKYYQSQLGQQAPAKLFITKYDDEDDSLIEKLSQALSIPVESLDINEMLSFKQPLDSETQARCYSAVGGAIPIKGIK